MDIYLKNLFDFWSKVLGPGILGQDFTLEIEVEMRAWIYLVSTNQNLAGTNLYLVGTRLNIKGADLYLIGAILYCIGTDLYLKAKILTSNFVVKSFAHNSGHSSLPREVNSLAH